MYRTDDPIADFNRWDSELSKWLKKLPTCTECDEPIQDEECFEFNGDLICPGCLAQNHRKRVEDYVE
jgi:formylmethanofuran dehydrogenase subunit E